MICPFCEKEMKKGILYGDGRRAVCFAGDGEKPSFLDGLVGVGKVTAARHTLSTFTIDAFYCETCRKMIFDTDIAK